MPLELSYINDRVKKDASGFVNDCETDYHDKVQKVSEAIADTHTTRPIVLLSGPSGSGKTTTAQKITEKLKRLGIHAHSVALDHYFLTRLKDDFADKGADEVDYESPDCIDWPLLNLHFDQLAEGKLVMIPHFSFSSQSRDESREKPLKLGPDDVVIFEGIHALNSLITDTHPDAFKLYISVVSDTYHEGELVFDHSWIRLVRRTIRDDLFRGADVDTTLSMWQNVRRGERMYIDPFKDTADMTVNTTIPYEIAAFRDMAIDVFADAKNGTELFPFFDDMTKSLTLYEHFNPALIPANSLLREFIGGGTYVY